MLSNLRNRFCILTCFNLIFSTLIAGQSNAQDTSLKIVSEWKEYREKANTDSNQQLVELRSLIPGLRYELRYATVNNFMKRLMYPADTRETYLRRPAARALQQVQDELKGSGYALKIFDAYRPYSVTVKFWELVRDERYVANPSKGSGHNRGISVDLTIIDIASGRELDMGTGFDNFTDTAHHNFKNLSPQILKNRQLLRTTMEKYGFRIYENEWWHYFIPGGDRYDVMDIDFKKLRKKIRL